MGGALWSLLQVHHSRAGLARHSRWLEPVQRRILYSMNKDGTFDKGLPQVCQVCREYYGNFHPHGDSSIYDAMVRMSQDWKNREILVEMHGNRMVPWTVIHRRLCVILRRACLRWLAIFAGYRERYRSLPGTSMILKRASRSAGSLS